MEAVGGPETYLLGGAFNCGKAQPGQVAAVAHGCPPALFRGVNILNTVREGGAMTPQETVERALRCPRRTAASSLATERPRPTCAGRATR